MDHGGGLRSRVSHNSPSSSAWGATADPYQVPCRLYLQITRQRSVLHWQAPAQNPYGGFDGGECRVCIESDAPEPFAAVADSHLKEVGSFGGFGGGGAGYGSSDLFRRQHSTSDLFPPLFCPLEFTICLEQGDVATCRSSDNTRIASLHPINEAKKSLNLDKAVKQGTESSWQGEER